MTVDRLIRMREVTARVGMSRATIYRKIALGEFPKPVGIGGQSVRWRESTLAEWMAELRQADHHVIISRRPASHSAEL